MTSTLSFPNPGAWLAILGLFVLSVPGVAWGAIEPGHPPRPPHAEVTPKKPLTGRQPLTVVFAPDVPLRAQIQKVAEAVPEEGRDLHLTIQDIVPPQSRDVGIRIFLNSTRADHNTSLKDPSYVTSVAFGQGGGLRTTPETFAVELGPTLRRLRSQRGFAADKPLTVTLVAAPVRPNTTIADRVIRVGKIILSIGPPESSGGDD
jgi:hypothetical protein